MTVECIVEDERWQVLDIDSLAQTAVDATLAACGLDADGFEISLLACDDARIATLNTAFRGKAQPTNVLSWPTQERGVATAGETPMPPAHDDTELGDIAIAYDTCAREAEDAGKPMSAHVTHLIAHGTLHLLGFDHERDADATLMEGLESQILAQMGLADPYGS